MDAGRTERPSKEICTCELATVYICSWKRRPPACPRERCCISTGPTGTPSLATHKVTHAQDKQRCVALQHQRPTHPRGIHTAPLTVTQDTPDHARLHEPNLALGERKDRDEQLDGVAECRVEQAAEGVADAQGKLLGAAEGQGGARVSADRMGTERERGGNVRKREQGREREYGDKAEDL